MSDADVEAVARAIRERKQIGWFDDEAIARAAIAAYEARQWRDISTAPKDGTEILLWDGDVELGLWDAKRDPSWPWIIEGGTSGLRADSPTHWRPLPAPPLSDPSP